MRNEEILRKEKEEKEKKRGGVPWPGGLKPDGAGALGISRAGPLSRLLSFLRGRGADGMGAITVRSTAQASSGGLASLMAGKLGVVVAGLVLVASGGSLLYNYLGGSADPGAAAPTASGRLGPMSSGIRIKGGGDGSLDYLSGANQGQVVWDAKKGEEGQAADSSGEEAKEEEAKEPDPSDLDKDAANNMAAQLAQQYADEAKRKAGLGGGFKLGGSAFGGGKSGSLANSSGFFGGKDGFGSLKSSLKLGKGGLGKGQASGPRFGRGAYTAMARGPARALRGSNVQRGQVMSSKAAKQLGFAAKTSATGAGTSNLTGARGYESTAFDQNKAIGGTDLAGNTLGGIGQGEGIPTGGAGITGTGGSTGGSGTQEIPCPSGWTRDSGGVCAPPTCPGAQIFVNGSCTDPVNKTPYQGQVDAAQGMGSNATMLIILGLAMIALGIYLISQAGATLGISGAIGIALVALGAALIAVAMMMFMMMKMMAGMIGSGFGQDDQQKIIESQAQKDPPPPPTVTIPSTGVGAQTEEERRQIRDGNQEAP